MSDISEQVNDYVAKRQEYQKLEKTLFKQIEEAFAQEVPILNSKMPSGYSIRDYDVWIGDSSIKPILSLNLPNKESGEITKEELEHLNDLLGEEIKRLENKYGIDIHSFQFPMEC